MTKAKIKTVRLIVPPELHAAIKSRAALEYRSLNEWCLEILRRQAGDKQKADRVGE